MNRVIFVLCNKFKMIFITNSDKHFRQRNLPPPLLELAFLGMNSMYPQGNSCLIWRVKPLGINVVNYCNCHKNFMRLLSRRSGSGFGANMYAEEDDERTRNSISTREEELLN